MPEGCGGLDIAIAVLVAAADDGDSNIVSRGCLDRDGGCFRVVEVIRRDKVRRSDAKWMM